jgi:hypothetical protein
MTTTERSETPTLIERLNERARIRRQIPSRKSVMEGAPDRIADLLEEAATSLTALNAELTALRLRYTWKPMKDAPMWKVLLKVPSKLLGMKVGLASFWGEHADGWMEIP